MKPPKSSSQEVRSLSTYSETTRMALAVWFLITFVVVALVGFVLSSVYSSFTSLSGY